LDKDHEDGFICKTCLFIFTKIHNFLDKKYGLTFFLKLLDLLCHYVIGFETSVCKRAIDMWAPTVIDALIEHYFDAEYLCSVPIICKYEHFQRLNPDVYAKELLKDKPENKAPVITGNRTLKVLHMSDVHTDLKYQEGSNGNCGKPLCCRAENGIPSNLSQAAGRWGYQGFCDLPRVKYI
jgi:sphingomyelin phosphodiesterase